MFIFKLLAGVLVLINDLIQCGGKGQQLIQVGGTGQQCDGAAVIQTLHRTHTIFKVRPALVVFGLLLVDLLLLPVNLVLLVDDFLIQRTDLLGQVADLA